MQIIVGARDGHAAHGNVLAGMLAALRELDAERIRGRHRVVEKQLEEIAHAVEEQKFRVLRLHLEVLRHHGRGALRLARVFARLGLLLDRRQVHSSTQLVTGKRRSLRASVAARRAGGALSPQLLV